VEALAGRGVVVSLGHSAATAERATAAVDAGARAVTHLFNAMAPFHHRAPGLAGVALTDDRLAVGVIADGHHLHSGALRLAVRALGRRLVLVSDAVDATPAGGTGPGAIAGGAPGVGAPAGPVAGRPGGRQQDPAGAVRRPDGTLAGGAVLLDRAVANLTTVGGMALDDAVGAATRAPARLLGLEGERGVVAPGAVGDLVLLDVPPGGVAAAGIDVVATVIGGRVAWSTDPSRTTASPTSADSPPTRS
jgi:N-acetylglucosamine-6-phosphate deacetylase